MIVMVIKNVMVLMFGRAPYGALLWTHLPSGKLAPLIIISLWHRNMMMMMSIIININIIIIISLWHGDDEQKNRKIVEKGTKDAKLHWLHLFDFFRLC